MYRNLKVIHIISFKVILYFLDFIRPEQKFVSVEQLKEQIEKDKSYALKLLAEGELL